MRVAVGDEAGDPLLQLIDLAADRVDIRQDVSREFRDQADPALDPAALAGWTMLVNEVLNLDEVLNK